MHCALLFLTAIAFAQTYGNIKAPKLKASGVIVGKIIKCSFKKQAFYAPPRPEVEIEAYTADGEGYLGTRKIFGAFNETFCNELNSLDTTKYYAFDFIQRDWLLHLFKWTPTNTFIVAYHERKPIETAQAQDAELATKFVEQKPGIGFRGRRTKSNVRISPVVFVARRKQWFYPNVCFVRINEGGLEPGIGGPNLLELQVYDEEICSWLDVLLRYKIEVEMEYSEREFYFLHLPHILHKVKTADGKSSSDIAPGKTFTLGDEASLKAALKDLILNDSDIKQEIQRISSYQ